MPVSDHLLSYFLGDPNGGGGNGTPNSMQFQDFPSVPHASSSGDMNPPLGMNASYGPGSSRTSSNSTLTEAAEVCQPRTPAMQFYHPGSSSSSKAHSSSHHHQQQQPPPTSYARQTAENIASMQQQQQQQQQTQGADRQIVPSGSSSSLSSMAANLVSGGSVLHHNHGGNNNSTATNASNRKDAHMHGTGDSPPGRGEDSPISPAAMIGLGNEQLMLPPPSRKNSRPSQIPPSNGKTSAPQNAQLPPIAYPQQPHNKEGHLEWLQQLNARAKAAATQNPNQPQQQQSGLPPIAGIPGMHPQATGNMAQPMSVSGASNTVYHAGSFPNAAAAAAAVAQNPMLYQAALNHKFHMAAQSQGETEEKRARRLERNRESARKSRRRKKERLATLSAQVDRLHTLIEDERRLQVNAMCSTIKQVRREEMDKLQSDFDNFSDQATSEAGHQRLAALIHSTSGGSRIAQATVEFQYNTLKQTLLPRYQKFLLWLTLHEEKFFTAGKDDYTQKDGKQVLRVSSGRVSSKQIGDELMNGWKTEKPGGKKKSKADTPDIGERSNPTSRSLDAPRMWPLLCFELSISVDQEERMLQASKRYVFFATRIVTSLFESL